MGILKSMIDDRFFAKDPDGRSVFYPYGKRKPGLLVGTESDRTRLRSFLKLHLFTAMAINGLGYLAGYGVGEFFIHASFERPAASLPAAMGIMAASLAVFLLLPALMLNRIYREAAKTQTAGLTESSFVPGTAVAWRSAAFFIFAGTLLATLAIAALVRYKP